MLNYREQLNELNFHDSNITHFSLEEGDLFDRKLTLFIDYYNWEGNPEGSENWETKTLKLTIDHCVHLQINAPNLMEDTFQIMDHEFDVLKNAFIAKALEEQDKSFFVNLKAKPLTNFLSLKLHTNNFADSLFNEDTGFIWFAGFNVSHEWLGSRQTRPKHVEEE